MKEMIYLNPEYNVLTLFRSSIRVYIYWLREYLSLLCQSSFLGRQQIYKLYHLLNKVQIILKRCVCVFKIIFFLYAQNLTLLVELALLAYNNQRHQRTKRSRTTLRSLCVNYRCSIKTTIKKSYNQSRESVFFLCSNRMPSI